MSGSGFSIPPYIQQNNVSSQYSLNGELPPEIAAKQQGLQRRQQIANLLIQQGMQSPQGQMAGRFYVAPSWTQSLAQLAQAGMGAYLTNKNDKAQNDLAGENQRVMSDAIQQYMKDTSGKEAQPGAPVQTPLQGPGAPVVDAIAQRQQQNYMNGAMGPNFAPEGQRNPELAASQYQESMGKAQQLYPDKVEGPQPTAMIPGPGTPAQPATTQEKIAAMIALRSKLGPAANPFLQMAQHADTLQAQQDFQAKEHQLTRDTTTAQAQQQRDFLSQEKALDRENKLEASKQLIDGQLAAGLISKREHDETMAQTQKLHDQRTYEENRRHEQFIASQNAENRQHQKELAADKAAAPKSLSPAAQKELFEADDVIASSQNATSALTRALEINDKAYDGVAADKRAAIASNIPGVGKEGANATVDLNNIVTGQALEQLRAVFGGMPTEGERKILLDLQGSVNLTAPQRKEVYSRAMQFVQRRQEIAKQKAEQLRGGTFFTPQGGVKAAPITLGPSSSAAPASTSGWSIKPVD